MDEVYDLIRRVHLYTSMLLLVFLSMYFVTGYLMTHPRLMPDEEPQTTSEAHSLELPTDLRGEELSRHLQQKLGLGGQRLPPEELPNGASKLSYSRPGTRHEVVVSPGRDEVRVTTTRRPSAGVIVGLHRLHKGGGGWKYDLWMVLYDAACLALILFAASGIYLWFKRTQKRALGWTLLALSFGYATAVTLYLVHAP